MKTTIIKTTGVVLAVLFGFCGIHRLTMQS